MAPRSLIACALLLIARGANAESAETTLTLRAALEMAKTRSADVRSANAQSRAAEAQADAVLAGYLPSLAGQGAAGHILARRVQEIPDLPSSRTVTGQQRAEISASLRWTPFDFGRTPYTVGAARADARAAKYRASASYNETARQVATTYFNVVFDELLIANAKASVQIRDRHAAIVRGQVASGVRTAVDEARTRVEVDIARIEETTAVRQSAQDKAVLSALLLLPPTTGFKLARPQVPGIPDDATRLAKTALEHHPEVRATANDAVARENELSVRKVSRLPSVGTSVDAVERRFMGDALLPPSERSLSAFVTITIPIFDWQIWGRVHVAEGTFAAAEAERDGTAARVQGEAVVAAHGLHAAKSVLEQSRSIRELAGATLAVMEARFQTGLASTTDLFAAASRDADARRSEIRAELDLAIATIEALAATGRMAELER